jgi:hypothetical protein
MTQVEETEIAPPDKPEEPVLTPKLSAAWALRLWHLPVIALWGAFFLLVNYLPLRPTDLWGHVAWGHWILDHGALPAEDPFQPLAEGIRAVDTAWLSQVILAAIDRLGGPPWLSNVFALVTLGSWLIIWRVLYLRTRSVLSSLAMVLIVGGIAWSRMTTIRPENFAWLAFALLVWFLVSDEVNRPAGFRWRLWVGVPLVMCAWANLHGSFLIGLAVVAAYAVGSLASATWRSRSLQRALADRDVQTYILVAELALVATCVNPYGVDLVITAVAFAGNANLQTVAEWQPLAFRGTGSYEFVAAWALAMILLRYSRRPVPLHLALFMALLGLATLGSVRLIGWFAVAYGVALAPLLDDLLRGGRPAPVAEPLEAPEEVSRGFPLTRRSWNYSLLALLLLWIPFSLSPISQPLVGGKPRRAEQLYGRETPLLLTAYLRDNPPRGPIFNPQWWGDWIVRDGPPKIAPFVTSNIHLVPPQVWSDYLRVLGVGPGWQQVLGRYAVETVIVDKRLSAELERVLRRDSAWQVLYEDPQCAVFGIRRPVPANRTALAKQEDETEKTETQK